MNTSKLLTASIATLFTLTFAACGGGESASTQESLGSSSSSFTSSAMSSLAASSATNSSSSAGNSSVASSSSSSSTSSSSSSASNSSISSRSSSTSSNSGVRAFPGAEGFGAMATGGRGGRVIKVTNLNASGAGSFRAAVEATGKRIIVFAVSGMIDIGGDVIEFGDGDVTIAGQTALGAGVTLQGRLYAHGLQNIIIRHLRIRPKYDGSDGSQFDGLRIALSSSNFIVDHCSVSFAVDENVDFYEATDFTFQWNTIESAHVGNHPDNGGSTSYNNSHNYGLINGGSGGRVSILNNLFAHNRNRNPAISNGPADLVGNVMYNVREAFHHDDTSSGGNFNVAGNYFKRGPTSILIPIWFDPDGGEVDRSYFVNAWVDLGGGSSTCNEGALTNPITQCDNNSSLDYPKAQVTQTKFDFSSVTNWRAPNITSTQKSYANVLAKAGGFPRDLVTLRSVTDTQNRTGDWGERRPTDLMQGLTAATVPTDSDNDGIADSWELTHGLSSSNGNDYNTLMPSGYTAIEEYINELADKLIN